MSEQLIISVGREFGSGGREIAQKLAEHYNLPMYDQNILDQIAAEKNISQEYLETLKSYDEVRRSPFLTFTVRGTGNSMAENVAYMQFAFLREKAAAGESFVVVGRCAESVLKDKPGLVSIFVVADPPAKTERIMRLYNKNRELAETMIQETDARRKKYHNSNCQIKWGDSRGYDLTINSTRLGINRTVAALIQYIDARRAALE